MGKHQTAAMVQVQISASKMSLKLCLTLAVVALAIPLVGANTVAGSDGCPDGTLIYHQGSHCCKRAVDHSGNAITYSSDNCQADDFIDCPAGAVDGACGPPPSNEPSSMPSNEPTGVVRFVQGQSSAGGGTYVCPAGSVDVGSEAECRSAATELGRPFEVTDSPLERKGCTLIVPCCAHMNDVHFNTHDQGSATEDAAPICALSSMLSNEPTSMPSNEPTSMLSNEPTSMPSNEPTSMPSNEPTAYVQGPISTTCFDLKSSYQNNSCCSQDTGNAATFNGTAVTCGNVLASYKSSECCDADLAKNATMIFE